MKEEPTNIENQHWFSNRQTLALIAVAVMSTATVVKVHDEFEFREARYQNERALDRSEVHVIEQRLDKKIQLIGNNDKRISKLEQKGSDEEN